jgi:hypothetical protein
MTRSLSNLAALLGLLVVLAAVPASAQVTKRMTVTIPFDFAVEKQNLPAGTYVISEVGMNRSVGLLIRDVKGRTGALVMTRAVRSSEWPMTARLEFRRHGEQYFLARVWADESETGHELTPSRQERRLAKDATRQPVAPPEVVTVAGVD